MVLYLDLMCQCGLHAVLWSHFGTLMLRLTAESRSNAGIFPLSVSFWTDLADPVFDGVGLVGFKSRANAFLWPKLLYPYYSLLLFFPFSSFCPLVGIVGTDRVYITLSQP